MATGRRTSVRLRLAAAALLAVTAGLVLPSGAAQAHAFLTSSNPGDGQVLPAAPRQLSLEFSEHVELASTRIELSRGSEAPVALTGLRLVTSGEGDSAAGAEDTEEPVQVAAALPPLERGTYRISWETLSSDDLHRTSGDLVFGVQEAVTATAFSEPAPRPEEAAMRWAVLLGLALCLGGRLARWVIERARSAAGPWAAAVCDRYAVWGAVGASLASVALLVDQLAPTGLRLDGLLAGGYGLRWAVRGAGLLLLVGATWTGRSRPSQITSRGLLAAGTGLACVGTALLGHSGAGAAVSPTRVVATAAHLAGGLTWAGALVVLSFVVVRGRRAGRLAGADSRAALRAFGIPAAVCVSVVAVTGLYLSSQVVGSVDALILTLYGRTLLLKVVAAGLAGVLALANTVRLHGRGSKARPVPARAVLAEAGVALTILALTAVLTSGQPALEPQLVRPPAQPSSVAVDQQVGDLQEALAVRPNRPGPAVALVDVFDTRRPSPGPVRSVEVSLVGPTGQPPQRVAAQPIGGGRWSAPLDLRDPGRLRLEVTVRRAGMPATTATFPWTVGRVPLPTRPATLSTAPLGPVLVGAAAGAAALVLLAWSVLLWRRRTAQRLTRRSRQAAAAAPDGTSSARAAGLVGALPDRSGASTGTGR
ncbi:copper resistance CopC/CopD family protein [Oryzihumus sp.]